MSEFALGILFGLAIGLLFFFCLFATLILLFLQNENEKDR